MFVPDKGGVPAAKMYMRGKQRADLREIRPLLLFTPREWGIRDPPFAFPAVRGPPPREWGILLLDPIDQCGHRSTPTRAGNTPAFWAVTLLILVHPHASGEYPNSFMRAIKAGGPPPREWGILCDKRRAGQRSRSTPTRVGNTPSARASSADRLRSTPTRVGNTVTHSGES